MSFLYNISSSLRNVIQTNPITTQNPQSLFAKIINYATEMFKLSKVPLDTLPKDILVNRVLSQLSIKDLGRIALVCKELNIIQNTHPILWEKVGQQANYLIDSNGKDMKLQVQDGIFDVKFGTVNIKEKKVILISDPFLGMLPEYVNYSLKEILSKFPKNHYILICSRNRLLGDKYYYCCYYTNNGANIVVIKVPKVQNVEDLTKDRVQITIDDSKIKEGNGYRR